MPAAVARLPISTAAAGDRGKTAAMVSPLGTLFLGERLGLWGLAGAGLILLGITVQNLHLPRRQKALARNG